MTSLNDCILLPDFDDVTVYRFVLCNYTNNGQIMSAPIKFRSVELNSQERNALFIFDGKFNIFSSDCFTD